MRVLVTGSREWSDVETISKALQETDAIADVPSSEIVLVHGFAKGADQLASIVAEWLGWELEAHPADWTKNGRRAGILRNLEMVRLGADVCLAFIKNSSPGSTHCADAAERAGIPVRRYLA